MVELYLIRNLLSSTAALSIMYQYGSDDALFSVISGNNTLSKAIQNNLLNDGPHHICDTFKLELLPYRLSSIYAQRLIVKKLESEILNFYERKQIKRLFLTYPMHLDSYPYYSAAKKSNIDICFFEEGPCFYRAGLTKQYSIVGVRSLIRKIYFSLVGLDFGYDFRPSHWFSSLPINHSFNRVNLQYKKVAIPNDVLNVFFSRPVSDDYPEIAIADEALAIKSFVDKLKGETCFIKFHPRELAGKKFELMRNLADLNLNVEVLDVIYSSEDLVYSMDSGSICGYDTTTLVYSNNINPKVKPFSVLGLIKDKETSGFLNECYKEYCSRYPHIEMIG